MFFKVHILCPIDLGVDLSFNHHGDRTYKKVIKVKGALDLLFADKVFKDAEITADVFFFGIAVLDVSFNLDDNYDFLANISATCENIKTGKDKLITYLPELYKEVHSKVESHITKQFASRLEEAELFPVFIQPGEINYSPEKFIEKHSRVILGITGGENRYEKLSDFILKTEMPQNIGYYADEIILIKRYGALIHSAGWTNVLELTKVSLAQYWSLKSYNLYFDNEMITAKAYLDDIPPYYRIFKIFKKYRKFSIDAIDFDVDKLSITESLYSVVPLDRQIDPDWHLRTVYSHIRNVFSLEELYRNLEIKIDRLENSYSTAREFLSTNFFILLDLTFFLSLIWSVLDTALLYLVATK